MATEYRLACPITSYSHCLIPDPCGILMKPEAAIQVPSLTGNSFFVIIRGIAGNQWYGPIYPPHDRDSATARALGSRSRPGASSSIPAACSGGTPLRVVGNTSGPNG